MTLDRTLTVRKICLSSRPMLHIKRARRCWGYIISCRRGNKLGLFHHDAATNCRRGTIVFNHKIIALKHQTIAFKHLQLRWCRGGNTNWKFRCREPHHSQKLVASDSFWVEIRFQSLGELILRLNTEDLMWTHSGLRCLGMKNGKFSRTFGYVSLPIRHQNHLKILLYQWDPLFCRLCARLPKNKGTGSSCRTHCIIEPAYFLQNFW